MQNSRSTGIRRRRAGLPVVGIFMLAAWSAQAQARFMSLTSFRAQFGFQPPALNTEHMVILEKPGWKIGFEKDSRKAHFNGTLVWLNAPFSRTDKDGILSATDVRLTAIPILTGQTGLRPIPTHCVVLDAGHGGDDPGAANGRLLEKRLVLDLAKRTRDRLTAGGIKVMLTRDRDQTMTLNQRIARAKVARATIFVSIHLNAAANTAAEGFETYLLPATGFASTAGTAKDVSPQPGNRFDTANMRLAFQVHRNMLQQTHAAERGIRRARYEVLKTAPCPAILVECGFLSNPGNAKQLGQSDHLDRIADGLSKGIRQYIKDTSPPATAPRPHPLRR